MPISAVMRWQNLQTRFTTDSSASIKRNSTTGGKRQRLPRFLRHKKCPRVAFHKHKSKQNKLFSPRPILGAINYVEFNIVTNAYPSGDSRQAMSKKDRYDKTYI